jgi:hypothetical protein
VRISVSLASHVQLSRQRERRDCVDATPIEIQSLGWHRQRLEALSSDSGNHVCKCLQQQLQQTKKASDFGKHKKCARARHTSHISKMIFLLLFVCTMSTVDIDYDSLLDNQLVINDNDNVDGGELRAPTIDKRSKINNIENRKGEKRVPSTERIDIVIGGDSK